MLRFNSFKFLSSLVSTNTSSISICSKYINDDDDDDADTFGTLSNNYAENHKTATLKNSAFKISKNFIFNDDKEGQCNVVNRISHLSKKKQEDDGHKITFNPRLSSKEYVQKLYDLCKQRKLREALDIFENEMKDVKAKHLSSHYIILITACGKAGYTEKAFQLYNDMKKRAFKPTKYIYTSLFNACANSPWPNTDGLEKCRGLKRLIDEKQIVLHPISYHAMIKAFGRGGDVKAAFEIADEMLAKGHNVTTETFNFLFQACLSDKENGFQHILATWNKLLKMKMKPCIHSYHILLRTIKECQPGPAPLPIEMKNPLKLPLIQDEKNIVYLNVNENKQEDHLDAEGNLCANDGHAPNVVPPSNQCTKDLPATKVEAREQELINPTSLAKPEERLVFIGGVRGLLKSMKRHRVNPNITTMTLILDSLPNNYQMEEELLKMLDHYELKPDVIFCNKLIRRRCLRNNLDEAMEILSYMQEHSLASDIVTFGCLSIGCNTKKEIYKFLDDMEAAHLTPSVTILQTLMSNALFRKQYLVAIKLLFSLEVKYEMLPTENMIKNLEKARSEIKDALYNSEMAGVALTELEKERMEIFLSSYAQFLKKNKVQLEEHPWKQYGHGKIVQNL